MERNDLINAGYSIHTTTHNKAKELFQKRVREHWSTLYFINVYRWRFDDLPGHPQPDKDFYSVDVSFYESEEANHWFNFEIHGAETLTVQEVEDKVAKVYRKLGFVPDVHNND